MAKTLNPMEAYRREQKKKELKKHRLERLKDKKTKLSGMDLVEIRGQLQAVERQVSANPADGPARKRKQELEDTLRAVVKKQKEIADEERKTQMGASPGPQSMAELTQANKRKFPDPEHSIYYHPTMNPFGAPPPGKPQVYRNMPSTSVVQAALRGSLGQGRCHEPFVQRRPMYQEHAGARGLPPWSIQQPREVARRPGKRPPLPHGPPPPGTIQVPSRPPLPSGVFPARPPPPPPACTRVADNMVPPIPSQPPPPLYYETKQSDVAAPISWKDRSVVPAYPTTDMNADDSVVAPYPLPSKATVDEDKEEEAAERAAENRAQLCSLVPVALRVQRRAHVPRTSSVGYAGKTPSISAPRRPVPAPPPPVPRPAVGVALPPPHVAPNAAPSRSVSKDLTS